MANDLSGPVWIIDTAGTITTAHVHIQHIRWVKATTAGHQCIITNANDKEVWADVASGVNYVSADRIELSLQGGFKVPTLESGKLYIKGHG